MERRVFLGLAAAATAGIMLAAPVQAQTPLQAPPPNLPSATPRAQQPRQQLQLGSLQQPLALKTVGRGVNTPWATPESGRQPTEQPLRAPR